jgi:hypothetical protein
VIEKFQNYFVIQKSKFFVKIFWKLNKIKVNNCSGLKIKTNLFIFEFSGIAI